jgi:hypothetical protein
LYVIVDTFLLLCCPFDVPFVSQANLFNKMSLKMEIFFQASQSFAICPCYEKSVLPVLKVELVSFWEALGLNNMP